MKPEERKLLYDIADKLNKLIDIYRYDKIVLISSLVLHENYRKKEITEEFIEMVYRDFHNDKTMIVAIVKPFQDYYINKDYYYNLHSIELKGKIRDDSIMKIPASEYYSLDKFNEKEDKEMNEYKLFSIANKCGFNRIGETFLFQFSPEKVIERILLKSTKLVKL